LRQLIRICGTFARFAAALAAASVFAAPVPPAATSAAPNPGGYVLPSAFEDPDDVPMPDPDLWHRIRVGFAMAPLDTPLVHEHEEWYASRPDYIKRFVDRGSRYLHHIVEEVEKRGMPMEVALLPVIESAFTPRAMSRAKASGIWQFIPSTGKSYGLKQDWWRDNRNDVVQATDAALTYLQRLHQMFGSWELALAAYNCGEGCVGRAIAANQKRGLPTDYLNLKLPPETRNYVPKLIAVKNIVLAPVTYGIELDSVPDQPYFAVVPAPPRIDVKVAAKLAGLSEEEFLALNPAHNRALAVPSSGIVLPVDKVDTFKANLEAYDKPLVNWTTYNARRGESLDAIARRHGVPTAQLKSANDGFKLDRKGRLRVAETVLVPMRGGQAPAAVAAAAPAVPARATTVARSSISVPTASVGAARAAKEVARTYTVRAGDTLYSIAQKFGTALDVLMRANRLTARSVIQPGLTLKLP
jgi:membrane-bound lytic murein transglycosylase D